MDIPSTAIVLRGTTASGVGKATGFTQLRWVQQEFERKLGFAAWPGTFNVRVADADSRARWEAVASRPGIAIEPPDSSACVAQCYRVVLQGSVQGAIVLPHVPGYPPDQVEILAAENVRERLGLADGDPVTLHILEGAAP